MYGYPGLTPVSSMQACLEIIKGFQVATPCAKVALWLRGEKIDVAMLPNGYVELDGKVPTLASEREFDECIQQYGASLEILTDQSCQVSQNWQIDAIAA